MLSIEECRKYCKEFNLTDKQIEELRNSLYCMAENVINNYIDSFQRANIAAGMTAIQKKA